MPEPLIQHVSDTAFMVATYRAVESGRSDALFRDPLAELLAGDHGRNIAARLKHRSGIRQWMVVIRTCIIDDYIRSAVQQGVDTVLNLGTGLDTRPYRMDLPGALRWVEVDYAHVIELKESRLAAETPRCHLERVKLDLADVSARRKFLQEVAASSRKTLVLTEGVIPYLRTEDAASLAEDLRRQPSIQYWITDYFAPEVMRLRRREETRTEMRNAPFLFAPADYFEFFREHGWRAKEIRSIVEAGKRLNRPMPLSKAVMLLFMLRGLFMSRERRSNAKNFMAYVLFEPASAG